jgi:hypothetical protein
MSHDGKAGYDNRRLGGFHSWSGCAGEEKNFHSLPGIKPQSSAKVILMLMLKYLFN